MYEYHGPDGLNIQNRKYSGDFKVYAVEYRYSNNLSSPKAAARLGIPSKHPLSEWERIYNTFGLILEVQRLQMENDYLIERLNSKEKRIRTEDKVAVISELRISYSISKRPVLGQVLDMLDDALEKINDDSIIILDSDQGWQYQHNRYQERLKSKGIIQSMSRKGNCLDNAVM